MTWVERSIGDFGRVVTGKTPSTKVPDFFNGDYMFVTPRDLNFGNYYCVETERTVSAKSKSQFNKQFVPKDTVMFTCIGSTIGKCGISNAECMTNQQINSVIPNEFHDAKFLYYLLHHNRESIRSIGLGGGSAAPIINKSTFSSVKFLVPNSKEKQSDIASMLSVYDDLIGNYQRQIVLLENMAQQLYKEWFVRFHFPGHEHVCIVDGIPDGWKRSRLIDVAEITMGQSPKSEFYNDGDDGLPFHQGVTNFGFRFVNHNTYCTKPTRLSQSGDILFSVRAPVGRMNMTYDPIIIGRGLSSLRSRTGHQSFLFYQLKSFFFVEDIIGGGTIYTAVTKKQFEEQKLLCPPMVLIEQFDDFASSVDQQIRVLTQSAGKLSRARDILLPRLMSGAISV